MAKKIKTTDDRLIDSFTPEEKVDFQREYLELALAKKQLRKAYLKSERDPEIQKTVVEWKHLDAESWE